MPLQPFLLPYSPAVFRDDHRLRDAKNILQQRPIIVKTIARFSTEVYGFSVQFLKVSGRYYCQSDKHIPVAIFREIGYDI